MSPIRRARGLPDGRVGMQAALARAGRTARTLSSRLWVAHSAGCMPRPVGPAFTAVPLTGPF